MINSLISSLSVTLFAYSFAFQSRSVITGRSSTSIGSSSHLRSGTNEFFIEFQNHPIHTFWLSQRVGLSSYAKRKPFLSRATQSLYLFSIFFIDFFYIFYYSFILTTAQLAVFVCFFNQFLASSIKATYRPHIVATSPREISST